MNRHPYYYDASNSDLFSTSPPDFGGGVFDGFEGSAGMTSSTTIKTESPSDTTSMPSPQPQQPGESKKKKGFGFGGPLPDDALDVVGGGANADANDDIEPHVLLPTKVYPHDEEEGGGDGRGSTAFGRAYPNAPVRWTAQPVVRWLETLVSATENAEAEQNPHHQHQPIAIGGILLGQPGPSPPPGIRQLQSPSSSSALVASAATTPPKWGTSQPKTSSELWVRPDESLSNKGTLGSAASFSEDGTGTDAECWGYAPKHWDVSYLQQRDCLAWMYTPRLNKLAVQLESMHDNNNSNNDNNHVDLAMYQMIQTRLEFIFGRILGQFPYGTSTEHGEIRFLLDTLYGETIRKLEELIVQAHNSSQSTAVASNPSKKKNIGANTSPGALPTGPPLKKKEFGKYMSAWLRENWTNPYPDEDGMDEIARDCGVTAAVVSNWLINARTRKWRPAIVKATELDRPSELLLEDSINIFEGKPIRDLRSKRLKTGHFY